MPIFITAHRVEASARMDKQALDGSTTLSAKPDLGSSTRHPNRLLSLTGLIVIFSLASLQFLRSYFIVNQPYLNAFQYELGTERMPYQSRILMAIVMRHAASNRFFIQVANKLRGPLHAPDVLAILLVDLFSLVIISVVVKAFYQHLSPTGRLRWLPYALVLWMASETYIVRFQEAIYFPYDILAAALFTLCIYLSYRERYLLLLPAFLVASVNRETIIMIIPLVLMNLRFSDRRGKRRWRELATALTMLLIWSSIHLYLTRLYAHNGSEMGSRVHENLHFLSNFQTWPQIASACGFLLPVPFLFWRLLDDRLRSYALLIPAWTIIMFAVGLLPESRIFGELIGLLAVLCTVIFERAYKISNTVANSSLRE
jgi:hypothetical protein